MFAAPPEIRTEVFTRLPDRFRAKDRPSEWLRLQRRGLPLDSFLEGPAFDAAGNLWVTDIPYGRIFRIDSRGDWELAAEYDGEPNGMKITADGRIFIADHKHGIVTLDAKTGRIAPYCDRPLLERFKGVNDLTFAPSGNLYFTDQGQTGLQDPTGRVYRLRADNGALELLMDGIPSPNGLVVDPDESGLHVAVTRANAVWRLPLLLTGFPSKVGLFIQMSGGLGPDGMAADEDGNLAVCHPGVGSVWLFSRTGEPLHRLRSCAGDYPTNCAYGGADRRALFITESHSGSILRAQMPVAGRVQPPQAAAGRLAPGTAPGPAPGATG
jgi:gluconolactonase